VGKEDEDRGEGPVDESANQHDPSSTNKTVLPAISEVSQDLCELFNGQLPTIVLATCDRRDHAGREQDEYLIL
jgi:hypothetical protein